jgi:hypothetical protein
MTAPLARPPRSSNPSPKPLRGLALALALAAAPAAAQAQLPPADASVGAAADPGRAVATLEAPGQLTVQSPRLRLRVGGSSNWRTLCARPGVEACADFDVRQDPARAGTSVDQAASVYLGFAADAELLPFAHGDSWLRGLGAALEYAHAFNRLGINRSAGSASTPTQTLTAQDLTLGAAALYRYPFSLDDRGLKLPGYVGLRAGVQQRSFVLEGEEHLEFNTRRLYPLVGLEALVPLARRAQVEAGVQLLLSPRPGKGLGSSEQRDLEVRSYGESVSSRGWSARLGLSGEVWGPFGYAARVQITRFRDRYAGAGSLAGWRAGGAAEETVTAAHWALTARY